MTSPAPEAVLPAVPQVDFAVFRSTCHRQLPTDDFEKVDAVWHAVFDAARRAFTSSPDPRPHLRAVLAPCQSPTQATITARATQAAAFLAGWHLGVDLDALDAMDDHAPVAAASDPGTWHALHAYRQPDRQAACALTLIDVTPTAQSELRLEDLDTHTMTLRHDDELVSLPALAGTTFLALRLARLAAGAAPGDPLVARVDGQPLTTRSIADAVGAVRRETGLRLASGQIRRVDVTDRTWAARRGVTAARLANP